MKSATQVVKAGFVPNSLYGTFEAEISAASIVSELIDNALDAGATLIEVHVDAQKLLIRDNGSGIEEMSRIHQIGSSGSATSNSKIGKFGVGAKDAMLAIGKRVTAVTRSNGEYQESTVDWGEIADMDEFPMITIDPPKPYKDLRKNSKVWIDKARGWSTALVVERRHKSRMRTFSNFRGVVEKLALQYGPALRDGVEITMSTNDAEYSLSDHEYAKPFLMLNDVITGEVSVDGKRATFKAGLADKAYKLLTGRAHISFGYRVITAEQVMGGHAVPPTVMLEVELSEDWKHSLSRNKNCVSVGDDELLEKVWAECDALMKKAIAQEQERRIQVTGLKLGTELKAAMQKAANGDQKRAQAGTKKSVRVPRIPNTEDSEKKNDFANQDLGFVDDANGDMEEGEAPQKGGNVEFRFHSVDNLETGYCDVRVVPDGKGLMATVFIQQGDNYVNQAFATGGEALHPMMAHTLAESFVLHNKESGKRLFPALFKDFEGNQLLLIWAMAGKLLDCLGEVGEVTNATA
jgi:hypothetical protein